MYLHFDQCPIDNICPHFQVTRRALLTYARLAFQPQLQFYESTSSFGSRARLGLPGSSC